MEVMVMICCCSPRGRAITERGVVRVLAVVLCGIVGSIAISPAAALEFDLAFYWEVANLKVEEHAIVCHRRGCSHRLGSVCDGSRREEKEKKKKFIYYRIRIRIR